MRSGGSDVSPPGVGAFGPPQPVAPQSIMNSSTPPVKKHRFIHDPFVSATFHKQVRNWFTVFLQSYRAIRAQVDIFAQQKTTVTDQPLTDGTPAEVLQGLRHGPLPSVHQLPLVQSLKNHTLPLIFWRDLCLGKICRPAFPKRTAHRAAQGELKFFPGRCVLYERFNGAAHHDSLLSLISQSSTVPIRVF